MEKRDDREIYVSLSSLLSSSSLLSLSSFSSVSLLSLLWPFVARAL